MGTYRGASSFDDFTRDFVNLDEHIKIFKAEKFSVKEVMEQ